MSTYAGSRRAEKGAEDRYQSAAGLGADLLALRERLARGSEASFPLGRSDFSAELHIPQKLYGREAEVGTLLAAFERAAEGCTELFMVTGEAGIGKSALVHEVHKAITRRGGVFVAGKFDLLNQGSPYASLAQALRELVRQLLIEQSESLLRWRDATLEAVGQSGQLLISLLPELEQLIGPQPVVPELGPTEAQNRFERTFQRFVRVFSTAEHPLVVFLDDLQWADAGSLHLLKSLVLDPEQRHLLVIGSYRNTDVDAAHPIIPMLRDLKLSTVSVSEVTLGPLPVRALSALLADALREPPEQLAALAGILAEKTHGNPFFVGQLLRTLYREQLLRFDFASRSFRHDEAAIAARLITENIVAFMADKLTQLPAASLRTLSLGACIGHVFDIATLATVGKLAPIAVVEALWPAIEDGLLLPLDPDYRFVHSAFKAGTSPSAETAAVRYRFLHDRVQQAAYSLLDESERTGVHLQIGRLLLARHRGASLESQIFDVVNHWNRGVQLITDEQERRFLAELNLRAGQKAKSALAFQSGAEYLRTGLSLLPHGGAEPPSLRQRELAWALRRARAECELQAGHCETAEALVDELLAEVSEPLEQVELHILRIVLYTTAGRFFDALAAASAGLKLLGVELPATDAERQQAFAQELGAIQVILESRQLTGANLALLIEARPCRDRRVQLLLRTLTSVTPVTYMTGPVLYPLVVALQVRTSLQHGHTEVSAYGYMAYAFILSVFMGRYAEARAFGEVALTVDEQFGGKELRSKLCATLAGCGHLFLPLPEVIGYARQSHQIGLEIGDFLYASYSCYTVIGLRFGMGDNLVAVRDEIDAFLRVTRRTREQLSNTVLRVQRQLVAALLGNTESPVSLDGEGFQEEAFLAATSPAALGQAFLWLYLAKVILAYLAEDAPTALRMAALAEPHAQAAVGTYGTTELLFYATLARLLRADAEPEPERARLIAEAHAARTELASWAASSPSGFEARLLMVEGELCRLAGQPLQALEYYEQAINAASATHNDPLIAITCELAARLCLKRQRSHLARGYLLEARAAYLRWGALGRAAALIERYPLLLISETAPAEGTDAAARKTPSVRGLTSRLLDIAAVIQSSQALSSELAFDKAVAQVMGVLIQHAGAEKGALVMEKSEDPARESQLRLVADCQEPPGPQRLALDEPIENNPALPVSIIKDVAASGEELVLASALADPRYTRDPYVEERRPKSVMALPLKKHGQLRAILYLENNLLSNAFSKERVELLRLLSGQAAIAVENALLYDRVRTISAELLSKNTALAEANQRLQEQLVASAAAERERTALQEEIIRRQDLRLAELSTPLIPISAKVMVMPLIGTMDTARAEQVVAAVLEGAQLDRAKVVIIDITGMRHIDTSVAAMLMDTARALRLVGAHPILSGIRAEVAQTLVKLGIDLALMTTRSTLQSAITYALELIAE